MADRGEVAGSKRTRLETTTAASAMAQHPHACNVYSITLPDVSSGSLTRTKWTISHVPEYTVPVPQLPPAPPPSSSTSLSTALPLSSASSSSAPPSAPPLPVFISPVTIAASQRMVRIILFKPENLIIYEAYATTAPDSTTVASQPAPDKTLQPCICHTHTDVLDALVALINPRADDRHRDTEKSVGTSSVKLSSPSHMFVPGIKETRHIYGFAMSSEFSVDCRALIDRVLCVRPVFLDGSFSLIRAIPSKLEIEFTAFNRHA